MTAIDLPFMRIGTNSAAALLREILCGAAAVPNLPASIPKLLTPREAADVLSISERALWELADRGEIAVVRLGRSTRYSPTDLTTLIEKSKRATGETANVR